jgi:hypothetical protein
MDCKIKDCHFKNRVKVLESEDKRNDEIRKIMSEKIHYFSERLSITEKKNIKLEVRYKRLLEKYCDNVKPFLCRVRGISKYYDRLLNVKTDYQYKAELRYEMNNPYDIKAVSVYWINPLNNDEPVKIGYIPREINENEIFNNLEDLEVKIKFTGNEFLGGLLSIKQNLNFENKEIENTDNNEFRDYSEYEEKRLEINNIINEIREHGNRYDNGIFINLIEYKKEEPELMNVIKEILAETEIEDTENENEIKAGIHYNGYYLSTLFSYGTDLKVIKNEIEYIIEKDHLHVIDKMKDLSFDITMIGNNMEVSDKSLNNDVISNYLDNLFDHIRNYSTDIGIKLRRKKLPRRKAG